MSTAPRLIVEVPISVHGGGTVVVVLGHMMEITQHDTSSSFTLQLGHLVNCLMLCITIWCCRSEGSRFSIIELDSHGSHKGCCVLYFSVHHRYAGYAEVLSFMSSVSQCHVVESTGLSFHLDSNLRCMSEEGELLVI